MGHGIISAAAVMLADLFPEMKYQERTKDRKSWYRDLIDCFLGCGEDGNPPVLSSLEFI